MPKRRASTESDSRGSWALLVLVMALVTALVVAYAPLVQQCTAESGVAGSETCERVSLVAGADAPIARMIAVWLLGCGVLPVVFGRSGAIVAAALLTASMVIALASVGLLLVPLVVVAWTAVARWPQTGGQPSPPAEATA